MRSRHWIAAAAILVVGAASCSDDHANDRAGTTATAEPTAPEDLRAAATRLDAIETALDRWAGARTVATAHSSAETVRNLVTGPSALQAGDLDRDGIVRGAVREGLLPGSDGLPGLAGRLPDACVGADVLGGDWTRPADRWRVLQTAIRAWHPWNNTFPSLPSHPQRIVGWASLTLGTDNLAEAHEYAGHARIHLDVTRNAIQGC